jgi:flagellar basal body-associated protein FliL
MMEDATSWFDKARRLGRSHLATQAAVLLPVVAIAGLTAWTMLSTPISARSQAESRETMSTTQGAAEPQQNAVLETAPAASPSVAPTDPPVVNGLKISSQSWRRGGLGSNALVTFTLRNDNNYAVRNIEIACAFSRQDGSHLTDRKRVIPDAVVNTKSRKTFAQMHIGFVNIYANKAKCAPIAANRI